MGKITRNKISKKERYLKKIVLFCIGFIVCFTVVSMFLNFKIGLELSPTLTTCVYAFFGTELAASAVIKIFESMEKKEEQSNKEEDE